jgi:hypothetical protein
MLGLDRFHWTSFFFITDVDVNMLEEEEDVPEVTSNKRQKVKK